MIIAPGSTDVITYFKLVDPITGVPETGLTIANLDATYVRDGAAAVKNDLSTPGGYTVSSAHTDNAAIVVDATNAPGLYRVDWPDAAFAAGVGRVQLVVNGAAIDPAVIEVELAAWLTAVTGLGVILSLTQGAITWAQQKIVANAANEGALDIRNSNANGHGTLNDGGNAGLYNSGGSIGQYNFGTTQYGIQATGGTDGINASGTANVGILANGAIAGQYNLGNGGAGYGQYNSGDIIGQYNAASAAGSAGQANQGIAQGQHNSGGTGQQNDGGAVGQYNTGTTYGFQNTGASGQVNVGTAGDGIYASGTDYGIQAVGVTGDIDPDLTPLLTGVNVTSIGNNVITAASIATDAIDADALATDAADEVADHVWDEAIGGHLGVGSTGAALNTAGGAATVFPAGAITFTYTVTDSVTGLPLEGVEVWISTDNPAVNIVWKGDTDAFGIAMDVLGNKPKLDAGTYYFWRQLAGYLFTDPDTEVVS